MYAEPKYVYDEVHALNAARFGTTRSIRNILSLFKDKAKCGGCGKAAGSASLSFIDRRDGTFVCAAVMEHWQPSEVARLLPYVNCVCRSCKTKALKRLL